VEVLLAIEIIKNFQYVEAEFRERLASHVCLVFMKSRVQISDLRLSTMTCFIEIIRKKEMYDMKEVSTAPFLILSN
jgi:hypothetical protein